MDRSLCKLNASIHAARDRARGEPVPHARAETDAGRYPGIQQASAASQPEWGSHRTRTNGNYPLSRDHIRAHRTTRGFTLRPWHERRMDTMLVSSGWLAANGRQMSSYSRGLEDVSGAAHECGYGERSHGSSARQRQVSTATGGIRARRNSTNERHGLVRTMVACTRSGVPLIASHWQTATRLFITQVGSSGAKNAGACVL